MVSLFNKSRRGLVAAGVVASAPLVLASACSEPSSSFFDPPMGGGAGGMTGGSTTGGNAGSMSTGGSGGKGGTAGSGGTSASGGSSTGGTDATGGTPGGGSGGDAMTAGSGGTDTQAGGTGGTDAMGGEGGMGEGGGMGGTTAGNGGTAGTTSDGGTSGLSGAGGTAGGGMGGTAGTGGTAAGGAGGTAGTASGGTGGASCTPATEVCDGVDNDCGNDIDEGNVCPNGCHGRTFEGETYLFCTSNDELEWVEAREFCMEAGNGNGTVEVAFPMTLVEIDSAEENRFLVDGIKEDGITDDVWHGANDRGIEGQWVWDRGGGSNTRLFYTVTVGGVRAPVNGAYHDWPTGQPTYNGVDCGIFDASDDFQWDDGSCVQSPLSSFVCGQIP